MTPTYKCWAAIKQRCTNKNSRDYKNYGGRGITLCRRWLKFKNVLEDMGEKPARLVIDRIDNDKGYSKKNCRWANRVVSGHNRRVPANNKTGYKGVYFWKGRNTWCAQVRLAGKRIWIGTAFHSREEAGAARKRWEYENKNRIGG